MPYYKWYFVKMQHSLWEWKVQLWSRLLINRSVSVVFAVISSQLNRAEPNWRDKKTKNQPGKQELSCRWVFYILRIWLYTLFQFLRISVDGRKSCSVDFNSSLHPYVLSTYIFPILFLVVAKLGNEQGNFMLLKSYRSFSLSSDRHLTARFSLLRN